MRSDINSFSNFDVKLLFSTVPVKETNLCSECFLQSINESFIVTDFLRLVINCVKFNFILTPSNLIFKRKANSFLLLLNIFARDFAILRNAEQQPVTSSAINLYPHQGPRSTSATREILASTVLIPD